MNALGWGRNTETSATSVGYNAVSFIHFDGMQCKLFLTSYQGRQDFSVTRYQFLVFLVSGIIAT
jgi:G:T-mismatch repair DNA endonuclease (very short patch repair protein)